MAQVEDRYKMTVTIGCRIEKVKDGGRFDHSNGVFDQEYSNVPYEGVVAVQAILVEMLEGLNGLGLSQAEAMGLEKQLEILGVKKKPKKGNN